MLKSLQLKLTAAFSFMFCIILCILIGLSLFNGLNTLANENRFLFYDSSYQVYNYLYYLPSANDVDRNMSAYIKVHKPYFLLHQEKEHFLTEDAVNAIDNNWDVGVDLRNLAKEMFSSGALSGYSDEQILEMYFSGELFDIAYPSLTDSENGVTYFNSASVETSIVMEAYASEEAQQTEGDDYEGNSISFNYSVLQFSGQKIEISNNSYRFSMFLIVSFDEESKEYKIAKYFFVEDMQYYAQQRFDTILQHSLLFLLCFIATVFISYFAAKFILSSTNRSLQRQADFVAAASHEFQNPITIIKNSLVLLEGSEEQQKRTKYLKIAQNEAMQLQNLTSDLLILAGSSAGKWNVSNRSIDLDTVLIDSHEKFQTISREKNIAIKLLLPKETLPPIKGDEVRVKQILDILLNNALQYSPKNSSIEISVKKRSSSVEIAVVDHGVGIEAEYKSRVFDKFFRVDKSRQTKEHFGLGLSVAKELTILHSGSLSLSDTNGGGATFTLSFPAKNKKHAPTI